MSNVRGTTASSATISGFKVWASETGMTWNGYRVHRRFLGAEYTRHPQDLVRGVPDNTSVPNARPEPTDVFLSARVLPSDL
jgi:hypothetical protein